jgi:hypothetical protein
MFHDSAKGGPAVNINPATAVTAPKTTAGAAAAVSAASARLSRVPAKQVARTTLAARFRMPGTPDPAVRLRRLGGVAAWAAVLGFGGLIVVLRIMIGLFTQIANWYLGATFALGLVGIACTVGAFASVHQRRLPWLLLGVATLVEAVCFAL